MRQIIRDPILEAMQEERDHLAIRLSMIDDPDLGTTGSVEETKKAIADLERRIAGHIRSSSL
jgi:hypothetical protein